MRALKAMVVIMGVLIVAGTTLLVTLMVMGVGGKGRLLAPAPSPEPAIAPAAAKPFDWTRLDLPAGLRVGEVTASGERIIVHLFGPAGRDQLLVVDAATGRSLGLIELVPTP